MDINMLMRLLGQQGGEVDHKNVESVTSEADFDKKLKEAGDKHVSEFFKNGEKISEFSGADPVQLEANIKQFGGVPDPDFEKKKLQKQEQDYQDQQKKKAAEDHGKVVIISSRDHMQDVCKNNKLVVVDFYADWCGPCRMMTPIIIKLSKDPAFADVTFVKVDTEAPGLDDVCDECRIRALPTFCFFKDGVKVDEFSGASRDLLVKTINKHR